MRTLIKSYHYILTESLHTRWVVTKKKMARGTCFLHDDNAPTHSTLTIYEFSANKKLPVFQHPSYFFDLTPYIILLFLKLKSALKGQRLLDVVEIKALTSEQFLRTFKKCKTTGTTTYRPRKVF